MKMLFKNRNRMIVAAASCLMLAGWSASSHAQSCTVDNWDAVSPTVVNGDNDTSGSVGSPPNFRRYAGPCALKVGFGGDADWVEYGSGSAMDESSYIARFYVFLDELTGTNVPVFEAYDSSNGSIFLVTYSDSGSVGFDTTGDGSPEFSSPSQPGWNSIEVEYDTTNLVASVNGAADLTGATTSSANVSVVRLGDVDGTGGGAADFDEFDSRRATRPGRLCRGLTDQSRDVLAFADAIAIFNDAVSSSTNAPGQPDYNEDGVVAFGDAIAVFNRAVGSATRPCSENL